MFAEMRKSTNKLINLLPDLGRRGTAGSGE